jgi:hypothetical protein
MICIQKDELENDPIFIEGDFISPMFATLAIHVHQCLNDTIPGIIC